MADTATSQPSVKPTQKIERAVIDATGAVKLPLPKEALRSVEIADVDLVLRFADGTDVVIPNGAIDALSGNAPAINFSDSQASSADLMKSAGKTAIVTAGNVRIVTEELDTRATTSQGGDNQSGGDQSDAGRPSIPALPEIKPATVSTPAKSASEGSGSGQEATIEPVQVDIPTAYKQGIKVNGIENLPIKTPYTEASFYVSSEYKLQPSGTTEVPQGSRTSANNALTDQARIQTITGTSGNDVIGHNSAFAPSTGVWESTLHLDFPNFTELSSVTLTLDSAANALVGIFFSSAQATQTSANSWSLVLDANTLTNGIDLLVRYNVAADGTSPNTMITMDVETFGKAGFFSFDLVKTLTFLYTNASNPEDFTQFTSTGDPIYTLPASGVGYKVYAGDGNDTVNAGSGADEIYGQAGNDTLSGDNGNDTLDGGAGADRLFGGSGSNTASYADATGSVVASLSTGLIHGVTFSVSGSGILNEDSGSVAGDAGGDLLTNIQNLAGSAFNDVLVGDGNANVLNGGAGNDTLQGMAGADTLKGGDGDDTLHGGEGADTLDGGSGSNTATYAGSAAVAVSLASGKGSGGEAEGDTLTKIQNLIGSAFADVLTGDDNANIITAGAGADRMSGGGGNDSLDGDAGDDTLEGGAGNDSLSGGVGADHISGGTGDDSLDGGDGDDTLEGGAGADSLTGGNGSNTASYENSAAVTVSLLSATQSGGDATGDTLTNIQNLIGSAYADTLEGNSNDNSITAGAGNDIVTGGAGNDALYGGDGDDTLEGGEGADALVGGNGNNTATYAHSTAVIVSLVSETGSGGEAEGDTLTNIQNLVGSIYADTLIGNDNANVITAGAGADTLSGGGGNDTIDGGDGDDTLEGGTGADALSGGNGNNTATYAHSTAVTVSLASGRGSNGEAEGDTLTNIQNLIGSAYSDTLTGDDRANTINAGSGDDILSGGANNDVLDGGVGADTLYGDEGADTLEGGAGDDSLHGGGDNDTLNGGDGDDTLEGGAGADALTGGSGSNTASYANSAAVTVSLALTTQSGGDATGDTLTDIQNLIGSAYADSLTGSTIANVITGGGGNDTISGGDGDDTVDGGAGRDMIDGGSGNDTVSYASYASATTTGVTASLTGGGATYNGVVFTTSGASIVNNSAAGDAAGDSLSNVENLTGSAYNDFLVGSSGGNKLFGGDGDDTLEGLGSADSLDGGSGNNTASYAKSGTAVTVSLVSTTQSGGDAAGDTLTNIQNLIGSAGNDTLTGDANANTMTAGAGADSISGGGGNDSLYGGDGNDTIEGGAGADYIDGGSGANGGTNTATYANSSAVSVSLLTGRGSGGDAENDTLLNIQNLIGSAQGDTLIGNDSANVINGGGGNDSISAGGGNDTIDGGAGADTIDGGAGTNTVTYANSGAVTVVLASGSGTGTGSGNDAAGDTLRNIQNLIGSGNADSLTGNDSANIISGGVGNDTLSGGGGNDTLDGGAGSDNISGGDGTDTVTYASVPAGTGGAGGVIASLSTGTFAIATAGPSILFTPSGSGVYNSGAAGDVGQAAGDTLTGVENLVGSVNNDMLIGSAVANVLDGGTGNDILQGMGGADTLYGGSGGTDTASYANAGAGVLASLKTGTFSGGAFSAIIVSQISTSYGSGYQNDNAHANTAAATDASGDVLIAIKNLTGSAFNDYLIGDATTANILDGGAGADILDGGGSTGDTVTYVNSVLGVTASLSVGTYNAVSFVSSTAPAGGVLNQGDAITAGDAAGDTLISIRNLTGTTRNDTLAGDDNANSLDGGNGDDTLFGLAGTDTLNGGNGDDVLEGGLGADTLDGGVGDNDAASYINATSGVTATLRSGGSGTGDGGEANGDTFTSIEKLIGSNFDDTLSTAYRYSISGMGGNDTITVSNATLPDLIDGGDGSDTVTLSSLSGGTVSLSALASLLSNVETLNIRDGINTKITLSGTDIQHIVSNGAASSLTILANSGDIFDLPAGSSEHTTSTSSGGNTDYTIYNSSNVAIATVHWQVA